MSIILTNKLLGKKLDPAICKQFGCGHLFNKIEFLILNQNKNKLPIAEEAIAAQMLDLGDDQENDDLDPDSNPDSGRVQSNDNSTKTASTLKAGGQNSQNSSLGSLDHDVARENGSANTLKSNGVSRNNLRNASATTQVSSEDYIKHHVFCKKRANQ